MNHLGNWQDASAIILSCPGPLRRHHAAIQPVASLRLPQILLGAESQLLAYADLAGPERTYFAAFPEMFDTEAGLRAVLPGIDPARAVHLRFGGVRAARILKGARNGCVLAECADTPPMTTSHHPFADGTVVPAAVQRVFALCPQAIQPRRITGALCPTSPLPDGLLHRALPTGAASRSGRPADGLDIACLADFSSEAWAAGTPTPKLPPPSETGCVLVPWNMDHPGSIVPELLDRLARLRTQAVPLPRIVLLPFNYIGQTGIIRDLIARLRAATPVAGAALPGLFIARVRAPPGLATLKRLSTTAWIDGNDPEHWWTLGRLAACAIATLLIDDGASMALSPTARIPAADPLWIEAETRCGLLTFAARLPATRQLPNLLQQTAALAAPPRPRRARA